MKLTAMIAVLALTSGACAPASTSTTSTSITTPPTSTTAPPPTTAPPSSTTLAADHPDLVVDPLVGIVAGEVSTVTLSGVVTDGSTIHVLVTGPDGTLVSENDATVEESGPDNNAYFQSEVTLAPGVNTIVVTATGPQGGAAVVTIDVRHEPEATDEFSFLTEVSDVTVVADFAQWLTGDEANQAAYEDGVIGSVEEGVPNDYHIRNENPLLRPLTVADDVRIWLNTAATGPVTTIEVTPAQWLDLFNNGLPWDPETDEIPPSDDPHFGYFSAGWVDAPYWLTILDGEVIAIVHQYTP